jgi:hypothetical protein
MLPRGSPEEVLRVEDWRASVSRAHDARRKERRRQARAAADDTRRNRPVRSRLATLLPVLGIAAVLAATAVLGSGGENDMSRREVSQKVTALLAGIPQRGATLGSASAPITIRMFADLECPTVKSFVASYLPTIIDTWVRNGALRLVYRSLKTDTTKVRTFLGQEAAALAAGKQRKMWNFVLTFVQEQGREYAHYATEQFFTDIASQVPGLDVARWQHDRQDPLLSRQVVLGIDSANARGLRSTPSFLLDLTSGTGGHSLLGRRYFVSMLDEVESSLRSDVESLREEAFGDVPTVRLPESLDPGQ